LSIADALGWAATVVFVASYFFRSSLLLRGAQIVGAALWAAYGVLIASKPVIAANVLVFAAAAWSLFRERAARGAKAAASGRMPPEESPRGV
jgi:hypothetical protein